MKLTIELLENQNANWDSEVPPSLPIIKYSMGKELNLWTAKGKKNSRKETGFCRKLGFSKESFRGFHWDFEREKFKDACKYQFFKYNPYFSCTQVPISHVLKGEMSQSRSRFGLGWDLIISPSLAIKARLEARPTAVLRAGSEFRNFCRFKSGSSKTTLTRDWHQLEVQNCLMTECIS